MADKESIVSSASSGKESAGFNKRRRPDDPLDPAARPQSSPELPTAICSTPTSKLNEINPSKALSSSPSSTHAKSPSDLRAKNVDSGELVGLGEENLVCFSYDFFSFKLSAKGRSITGYK